MVPECGKSELTCVAYVVPVLQFVNTCPWRVDVGVWMLQYMAMGGGSG